MAAVAPGRPRGRALMVQGCSSDAGKSYLAAALCRIYADRGLRVAPFKAQNMSNNAAALPDGREIGRAQAVQARAARIAPDARMNPVLIKPEGERRSQVLLLGRPDAELARLPWTGRRERLWPVVRSSLHALLHENDLVVIEGAGSPAEINLRAGDVVNMAVALEADAAVLLACDIDRGGAFAHLLGTWALLAPEERALLAGFVLNRFRGDPALLGDAPARLQARTGVPTLGVVPHLRVPLADEDAFSLERRPPPPVRPCDARPVIAVLRPPSLSNFDEFAPLDAAPGIRLLWAESPRDLDGAAAVVLPGSKAVLRDLAWMRATGLDDAVAAAAARGVRVLGVCGGYGILGRRVEDPHGIEGGGAADGLGLLDAVTVLAPAKTVRPARARLGASGPLVAGYEIHHGATRLGPGALAWLEPVDPPDGPPLGARAGRVAGTYLHGLFEDDAFRAAFLAELGVGGADAGPASWSAETEAALDRLAAHVGAHLDLDAVDRALDARAAPSAARAVSGPRARVALVSGGARSGKSALAERLAAARSAALGGAEVAVIVTLEPLDDETRRRVARHRADRPATWRTLEAPRDLPAALRAETAPVVLVDCVSAWIARLVTDAAGDGRGSVGEEAALAAAEGGVRDLLEALDAREGGCVVIVSNEVGSGVVPASPLGRWYRDALGRANRRLAERADDVALVALGRPIELAGSVADADGALPPGSRSGAAPAPRPDDPSEPERALAAAPPGPETP